MNRAFLARVASTSIDRAIALAILYGDIQGAVQLIQDHQDHLRSNLHRDDGTGVGAHRACWVPIDADKRQRGCGTEWHADSRPAKRFSVHSMGVPRALGHQRASIVGACCSGEVPQKGLEGTRKCRVAPWDVPAGHERVPVQRAGERRESSVHKHGQRYFDDRSYCAGVSLLSQRGI